MTTELIKLKEDITKAHYNKLIWWPKDNKFCVPPNKNNNIVKILKYLIATYPTIKFCRVTYSKNVIEYSIREKQKVSQELVVRIRST